jgi:hypothetical protein
MAVAGLPVWGAAGLCCRRGLALACCLGGVGEGGAVQEGGAQGGGRDRGGRARRGRGLVGGRGLEVWPKEEER